MPSLSEEELIAQFEACTLAPSAFPHREHVRLAWAYLRRESLGNAIAKFCGGLKLFAASIGKAGLYHETVSWAFMLIIQDRIARGPHAHTWEAFAAANPDLLANGRQLLERYYQPVTLDSPLARVSFIWPDRAAQPAAPSDRYPV
jgi:nitroreductase